MAQGSGRGRGPAAPGAVSSGAGREDKGQAPEGAVQAGTHTPSLRVWSGVCVAFLGGPDPCGHGHGRAAARRQGEETLGTAGPETPALLALLSLPPGMGEAPRSGAAEDTSWSQTSYLPCPRRGPSATSSQHRALSRPRHGQGERRLLRAQEAVGARPPVDAASGHVPLPDPADPPRGQVQGRADKREHNGLSHCGPTWPRLERGGLDTCLKP